MRAAVLRARPSRRSRAGSAETARCRSSTACPSSPPRCARAPCRCRSSAPADRVSVPSALPLELHEDVVPDLDEALGAGLGVGHEVAGARHARRRGRSRSRSSGRRARCRPWPRSCRPSRARRSVLGGRNCRQTSYASSSRGMPCSPLKMVATSRVGIELPLLGQQRPGQRNGVVLEVVAEREIAEHLEERVMAKRRPDVVEVVVLAADAHALLRRGRARVVALLAAEEHVLELVHAGVGEEQRRDRRRARAASSATTRWPCRSKYFRKDARISLGCTLLFYSSTLSASACADGRTPATARSPGPPDCGRAGRGPCASSARRRRRAAACSMAASSSALSSRSPNTSSTAASRVRR